MDDFTTALHTENAPATNHRLLSCLREPEFWLLAVLIVGVHFSRLTDLVLRGEETRRGIVAIEMLRSGDWIVPSIQEDVYFMSNRPPLQQWLIASIGWLRGGVDAFAVRLPSAIAVLLTSWLVYAYGRIFLKRAGAFAAAVAFATMGQVLELGRLGESDPLFTLFLSGSLLLWHAGRTLGWPEWKTWSLGYLFAALATLTKGPQAPVYFAAGVGLSLLVTRGICSRGDTWSAWPFFWRCGGRGSWRSSCGPTWTPCGSSISATSRVTATTGACFRCCGTCSSTR
jgi:4-amino-4-deoxy-L-arabinose transferase-like glycosyltransferase